MSLWRVGIDIGGTFTDLVAGDTVTGERLHLKVLTTPGNPAEGFLEAVNTLKQRAGLGAGEIGFIFHGTTLATNAIIQRRVAPTALVTTKGFRDILEIGRHWRTDLYDLDLERPDPLVGRLLRFEVAERIGADQEVIAGLDAAGVDGVIEQLQASGVKAVAVVLLHSYGNPAHEEELAERLRASLGDVYVSASSELTREPREFERASTTVLNAALMPLIDDYLSNLEAALGDNGETTRLYLTHSNGGALSPEAARSRPVGLAQSGPVAGVHSCVRIGEALGFPNVIGFDMGGTSADIALIEGGQPRLTNELDVGGLPVRLPSVHVLSIGAGGGSVAWLDAVNALRVGPDSAGAAPGPACYGRGGDRPTVTDCNLILGRLPAEHPLAGFLSLDLDAAKRAVRTIAEPLGLGVEEAADGVIEVVNAGMEGAIRVVLREHGNDPRDFALVAFGGAGALHAVELAARLAIGTVIVPQHPGTFSAQGLLASDVRHDFGLSRPLRSDEPDAAAKLSEAFGELERIAAEQLADDPDFARDVTRERRCEVRYLGQAYEVGVPIEFNGEVDQGVFDRLIADFHDQHERAYAFANRDEPCEIRIQRLFVTATVGDQLAAAGADEVGEPSSGRGRVVYHGEELDCLVVDRSGLRPGDEVVAPAVVLQEDATTFIPPGVRAHVAPTGDLLITDIPPA
ncbi:MAG: hydantoinase/oxoprolinase family protein [Solirubrobacteraceae bacterium]|nr:hydantoinase/oxoprolinase family protein [Solirubrobacteraceae bacterium]